MKKFTAILLVLVMMLSTMGSFAQFGENLDLRVEYERAKVKINNDSNLSNTDRMFLLNALDQRYADLTQSNSSNFQMNDAKKDNMVMVVPTDPGIPDPGTTAWTFMYFTSYNVSANDIIFTSLYAKIRSGATGLASHWIISTLEELASFFGCVKTSVPTYFEGCRVDQTKYFRWLTPNEAYGHEFDYETKYINVVYMEVYNMMRKYTTRTYYNGGCFCE